MNKAKQPPPEEPVLLDGNGTRKLVLPKPLKEHPASVEVLVNAKWERLPFSDYRLADNGHHLVLADKMSGILETSPPNHPAWPKGKSTVRIGA